MWGKVALGVIAVLVAISLFNVFQERSRPAPIAFSDFISEISKGTFTDVVFRGRMIEGRTGNGRSVESMSPFPQEQTARYIYDSSRAAPVRISSMEEPLSFTNVALSWVPMLFVIGFWVWFVTVIKRSLDRLTQAVEKLSTKAG
jgi:ATP-dependent Zn protease